MQPKFAILLAAFNGKKWIMHQIDSILSQEGVAITLFINVDQSSDGTENLVEQLSKKDSRIHVFPCGKYYGGAGPNFYQLLKSVDFSQYDFIALSDQDDIWLPRKLINGVCYLRKSNADIYSSNITAFWPNGKKLLIDKAQKQTQWDFLFEAAGPGCTYIFTQKFASTLQKFINLNWNQIKKISLHDWLIYAYARANNYSWKIDPCPGILYRQHSHNQVGANVGLAAFVMRARKVLNGWGLHQSLLIANAIGLGESSFVSTWSKGTRLGYLKLSTYFWKCRRKPKDKLLFFVACIGLALIPPKDSQ